MEQTRTVRKHLEQKLEIYSVDEMVTECRKVLKDLRKYPNDNKWQIRYYEILWKLLNEY
jgi:hypothetical protein